MCVCVARYVTKQVLMTRPREEWMVDVTGRYRALGQFSKEDARLQFLRILRSLPYGELNNLRGVQNFSQGQGGMLVVGQMVCSSTQSLCWVNGKNGEHGQYIES